MPADDYFQDDAEEEAELEFLRESLEQMDNLADKTTQLLKVFDIRLKNLGRIIAPIYKSTQKLTRLYDNVEMTIGSLDDILLFFNVAKDESDTIRAGPDESELLPYLDSINRLKDASDALRQLDLDSASQSRKEIHELLRIGLGNLSLLFRQWLKQYSGGVDPAAYANSADIPTFPTDTVKLLSMLATYLNLVNDEVTYDLKLTKTYATIRNRHLLKSLAQFTDMCNLYMSTSAADEQLSAQPGFNGSSNSTGATAAGASSEIRFCAMRNEHWYEPGTSPFVQYTLNIVKLFQAERDLVRQIMPTIISQDTFLATAERPFESYINTGEAMVSSFLSSPLYEVLHALDVYGCLIENEPELDSLLALGSRQSKELDKLIARLYSHLSTAFTALISLIDSPAKEGVAPKQTGGVHDLVYNTVNYLTYLIGYKDLLTQLFLPLGDGHWNQGTRQGISGVSRHASDPSDGLSIFQHYLRDVVGALSQMIEQTGKQMKRPGLQFVFLINNHSYLVRALKDSMHAGNDGSQTLSLGDLVGKSVLTVIESSIERSRKGYIATWMSTTSSFPAASLSPAEKLSLFNQGLDDMIRAQKSYEVTDTGVRMVLVSDAIDAVIPTYDAFLKQNPDRSSPDFARALKYSAKDLKRKLEGMLED
ncbi:exocyst complex component exo70 [Dipsacomyces acuminosporus]|nr:exocyst complex component exo70 [Dipsacomyces acuminosporus]